AARAWLDALRPDDREAVRAEAATRAQEALRGMAPASAMGGRILASFELGVAGERVTGAGRGVAPFREESPADDE
ncbi:MAG: hypothetical protein ACP5QO_15775, partial [Clostridia bacterium]